MQNIYYFFCLIFLFSCGAVPDEVSASGFSSRYEFLGAGSLKGDGNDYGDERGVMLTATYKLKPQTIRIVEPIRVNPIVLPTHTKNDTTPENHTEDPLKYLGSKVKETSKNIIDGTIENFLDTGKKITEDSNLWQATLGYLIPYKNSAILLIFFAILLLIVKKIYTNKK